MPHFFFHIVDAHFDADDKVGLDLPSLDDACIQARKTVGAIIADELAHGEDSIPVSVTITDQDGETVTDWKVHTKVVSADDSPTE